MATQRSWMLINRGLRSSKVLRNREENKDDVVKLNFNSDPPSLMREILINVCKKHGISSVKKMNYLNAFVHLISKNPGWKSPDTFGFTFEEIVCCLRVALIQDSVQIRAVGLRALRYVVRNEENVLTLNKLHFPYLIARSLDLLLKTDNERVLMSERIQALKIMRHILSLAPQLFSPALIRPLVSVALRPVEETDRLLKACIAILCELCILNPTVFIECDGVRALLRNAILIPSSHIVEAICGALLFLLNKPSVRESARVDLHILISGYTNSMVTEKNSFREEERRLTWTNFALLTVLRSCSGIFELCNQSNGGLKSIVHLLYLNKTNVTKAILELLYDLINIPQPDKIDDDRPVTDVIDAFVFRESFKISEGFVISEAEQCLPSLTKNRANLIDVHTAFLLLSLLEAGLPDALVEVIVSGESTVSLNAAILLGEFLNLSRQLLPAECYSVPPTLPNLVSYAVRGCPLQLPSFTLSSTAESDEQYFYDSFSHYPKEMLKISDGAVKSPYSGDNSTKTLDLRLSYTNLNVPDNDVMKSSHNGIAGTKDKAKSSTDISDQDFIEDFASHESAEVNTAAVETAVASKCDSTSRFPETSQDYVEVDESLLNEKNVDVPPCKEKQKKALSAVNILSSLRKKFENPPRPISLLLSSIAQYGEQKPIQQIPVDETINDRLSKKRAIKTSFKELEELLKETGVLIVPEATRWKWEAIRVLLKMSMNNVKMLNDTSFKNFLKKLIHFFKPSSKKYSHTPLKPELMGVNIYTLVACDLMDVLLDSGTNDGLKMLSDFLEDLEIQFKKLEEAKSVHDCLLSPSRLMNSLSQDYFLLLGRLSNSDAGLLVLEKSGILQKLQHIACNINLDCYVKLIISSLSYIHCDTTRKLLSSVLSCSFAPARLYATKYLLVLLRIGSRKPRNFQHWVIEMLVNQLYDENPTIAMIALSILNEAADNRDYLDSLVSLRPSLLHLGDTGLLLLIRFLSTEKGFAYLQAANFVVPQLQRWASSFNVKYVQIVEGEIHDALSQYQRGDDGRYRKRITGCAAKLKNVIVPPHLYGQLVQHAQGFELLLKQECINSMIQTILIGNYDNDEAVIELKAALWALGHFTTSSMGAKYLHGYGVIKAIVALARSCSVYAVKMTAVYVLSMIATSKEGAAILNATSWRCLKRSRYDNYFNAKNSLNAMSLDKLLDYDCGETMLSPDLDSPQSCPGLETNSLNGSVMRKIMNKFKSATLPQRTAAYRQVQHNRSLSESKADVLDDWSSSGSPQSNFHTYISEIKSHIMPNKYRSDSFGTDSSTSGVSSCDSVPGKPSTYSERLPTLSPIPSTSSLSTVMTNAQEKDHNNRSFLSKRHSSINFGVRLNTQHSLGYKTLRILQNRHQLSNFPQFSASATMEYLSAPERRQMSPLVRPKFPRYLQKPTTPEFEVKSTPFQIDANESLNFSSTIESSQFSHSTEIDEDRIEFEGPCYQGICLPLKMSYLLPGDTSSIRSLTFTTKPLATMQKSMIDEVDLSDESDSERIKGDENRVFRGERKRRRHDKSTCILCSVKPNAVSDRNLVRSRRTSTSSVHRIRTETESSYGGGIGIENESPIFLNWQQKPVGLADNALGGASCSTLENSDSQSTSGIPNNDHSMKSRSIMRRDVLKTVEQLGNPILYRTCKQGLLSFKQICSDLFQDICLFSDICSMLGQINYRIQARQLIQDLFLDAPFHELYEEVNCILNRTSTAPQETEDSKPSLSYVPALIESALDTEASQHGSPSTNVSKDSASSMNCDDQNGKAANANAALEVIIETDTIVETAKNEASNNNSLNTTILPSTSAAENCSVVQTKPLERSSKNLYDCRRAYSYPATNYIITGLGIRDPNGSTLPYSCTTAAKIAAARSRSVSATCSYISEVAMKRTFMLPTQQQIPHHQGEDELTTFSPLLLEGRIKNFAASFSKRPVLTFADHSPSVMLTFENPYEVMDLDSQLLLQTGEPNANNVYNNDSSNSAKRDEISQTNVNENDTIVTRHRKLADFNPPDNTILLEHSNPNM